jgi:hypothetical protein
MDKLYLTVEPRNEIGASTSRAPFKKGITLLFVGFPSSSPEFSKKFPVTTITKGVGSIIVEENERIDKNKGSWLTQCTAPLLSGWSIYTA